ncbi:hypothetical protein Taro_003810, partial [Colocasia esculenta]|nr:hypothetical protein [Colocasia esculenta]
ILPTDCSPSTDSVSACSPVAGLGPPTPHQSLQGFYAASQRTVDGGCSYCDCVAAGDLGRGPQVEVVGIGYLILILTGPTTSAPLPPAAGRLTTSTPLLPVAGPTASAPLPLTAGRLTASASPSHMASGSTPPPAESVRADDETSHHEGEGSYNETMRAVWINEGGIIDSQSIQMSYMLDLHGQLLQVQISNFLCTMSKKCRKSMCKYK